mmetsp:Transcript_6258/g.17457  ORF Transcript_6258/g.17457 Transcript_6258/m.17457 type:complete len:312 (+) Transcript_6258:431-1366(+)
MIDVVLGRCHTRVVDRSDSQGNHECGTDAEALNSWLPLQEAEDDPEADRRHHYGKNHGNEKCRRLPLDLKASLVDGAHAGVVHQQDAQPCHDTARDESLRLHEKCCESHLVALPHDLTKGHHFGQRRGGFHPTSAKERVLARNQRASVHCGESKEPGCHCHDRLIRDTESHPVPGTCLNHVLDGKHACEMQKPDADATDAAAKKYELKVLHVLVRLLTVCLHRVHACHRTAHAEKVAGHDPCQTPFGFQQRAVSSSLQRTISNVIQHHGMRSQCARASLRPERPRRSALRVASAVRRQSVFAQRSGQSFSL